MMYTTQPELKMLSGRVLPAAIGGEFPLDPFTLGHLPDGAGWRGLPGWELPQTTYVAAGRMALTWGLRAQGVEPGPIWIPEYICYSVLHTLLKEGWTPRPYPLREDLSADLDAWGRIWKDGSMGCLVVHYFGFPQPPEVWDFLSQRHARPLVEDRTHSVWNSSVGVGDIVFASLRKWLALPDGGVVRTRVAQVKPQLAPSDDIFVRLRLTALVARHTFLAYGSDDSTSEPYFLGMIESSERRLDGDGAVREMSQLSQHILQTNSLSDLVVRRRNNYERLADALQGHPRVRLLHRTLPAESCPIGCPVLCENRDQLRARLMAERIYCAVHWPLENWPMDWATPSALALSRRILTLNVDQRMEPEDVDRLAAAVWTHGV